MRNVVKVLALNLIMSVILRDVKGARSRINAVKVFGPDDLVTHRPVAVSSTVVSVGENVTEATGLVNCKLVRKNKYFLAPTGAQGDRMSCVRACVRPFMLKRLPKGVI